jgi:hypothetical protein
MILGKCVEILSAQGHYHGINDEFLLFAFKVRVKRQGQYGVGEPG